MPTDSRSLPDSQAFSVSCPTATTCTVVGSYRTRPNAYYSSFAATKSLPLVARSSRRS
jgi:hypothetical protein